MSRHSGESVDGIDDRRAQWRAELPDVDTLGMSIFGRMRLVTLLMRPSIEGVFSKHGLDSGEFDVLATLLRSGPPYRLRPTELYRSLMISSGGLTDRLARLSQAGLVKRSATPGDARSLSVELTAAGRKLANKAFREDMAVELAALSQLSPGDLSLLEPLLRKLTLLVTEHVATRTPARDV